MFENGVSRDLAQGGDSSSSARRMTARDVQDDRLRRARGGDGVAFTELIDALHVPLCNYLARLVGDDEVGRDLAQEALIRAWRGLPTLREERFFKAWVYGIGTNLARSHLRRARLIRWLPWRHVEEGTMLEALRVEGPEAQVGEAEVVEKTLAQLSPQYRACLLLQVAGGFSQQEIARLLGISQKSVGSNVCRAREQFRRIYASLKGEAV